MKISEQFNTNPIKLLTQLSQTLKEEYSTLCAESEKKKNKQTKKEDN